MLINLQNFVQLIAALYIFLFTYTGVSKLLDPVSLRLVVAQLPMIGSVNRIWILSVPIAELLIAIILFFPQSRIIGLFAATGLMIVFSVYIGYMLLFAANLPCSCGGVISDMSWHQHLVFNIIWILLGILSIWLSGHQQNIIAIIRRSRKPGKE